MAINPNTDFSVGQILTAGNANRWPRGVVSFTQRTTTSSFAGLTTNITSASFDVLSGRYYKVTYFEPAATIAASAATNSSIFNVTASVQLGGSTTTQVNNVANRLLVIAIATFTTGTITVSGRNQSTVGGTNLAGSATTPAFLLVEDIGPS